MPDLTVTIAPDADGGEPLTLPAERLTLPDGYGLVPLADYVPKATADARVSDAVRDRLKNHIARDKAATDPDIVRAVKATLDADGARAEDAIRASVHSEYAPKLERLSRLEQAAVASSIVEAARQSGVRDEYLKPLVPGGVPPIVTMVQDSVRYDEERGYVVAVHGGTTIPAKGATTERPWAGPEGLFDLYRQSAAHLFKGDSAQGGSGYNGAGAGSMKRSAMAPQQAEAFIEKHGTEAYLALPT